MKRKWILSLIGLSALFSLIYYFYLAKPTNLTTTDVFKRYEEVTEILDVIEIDDRRVFVPVVTKKNEYGMSIWLWKNHKWKMEFESTSGSPWLLKVKNNDPSSYKVFWNIHPNDQINYGEFYFIKKRNYRITEGIHHYYPQLQMKTILHFEETPYGIIELPKEWQKVMEASIKLEKERQPNTIFDSMFPVMQDVYFGWIPYNNEHVRQRANATHVGGASWGGAVDIEHVMDLPEEELEFYKAGDK